MTGQLYRTYAIDCVRCCVAKLLPVTATTPARAAAHLISTQWTRRDDGWWCARCSDAEAARRRLADARGAVS